MPRGRKRSREKPSEYYNTLSNVPKAPCPVDSLAGLPYIPKKPLPSKSFSMYIVGNPGSGKTNLWLSMMLSKKPLYYRKFFDRCFLVSGSMATLPSKVTKGRDSVPEKQQYTSLDDEVVSDILEDAQSGEVNNHNLLILDDVIKDITRSKSLSHVFLNRRHITHDSSKEGLGGLSIMTISQKYNLLPLEFRNACDHVILFKTENAAELRAISEELMQDLDKEQRAAVFRRAWRKPYGFLMIKVNAPSGARYYDKFDLISLA